MKYTDLPPELQAQVDAKIGGGEVLVERRVRTTRKAAPTDECFSAGHCTCGAAFPKFTAYERHRLALDEPGHARFIITIPDGAQ